MPAARDVGHYAAPKRKVRRPPARPRPAPAPSFPRAVPSKPGAVTIRPTPKAKRVAPPTVRARAQERGYVSQGKAVPKAARQQRETKKVNRALWQEYGKLSQAQAVTHAAQQQRRRALGGTPEQNARIVARQYKREGERSKVKGPLTPTVATQRKRAEEAFAKVKKGDQLIDAIQRTEFGGKLPKKGSPQRAPSIPELRAAAAAGNDKAKRRKIFEGDLEAQSARQEIERAGVDAPVLKVLEQTMRSTHAIAGGAKSAVKGESVGKIAKAAGRGAALKDKTTFSDVLKEAGVKNKAVRGVAGFGLDVATDPLTYLTFGVGSAARKAATRAGERAAEKAAEKGMSESGIATVRRAAERRMVKDKGRGLTVKFAGKEVPGVLRGTARVGRATRPIRRLTPAPIRRAGRGTHKVARHLRPMMRPHGISREQWTASRHAARTARVSTQNAEKKAYLLARDLRRRLPAEDYAAVIDAIERNNLGKLPKHIRADKDLVDAVHDLRSALRGYYRVGRRAGAIKGKVGDENWLKPGHHARLRATVRAETAGQARRVASQERKLMREQGREQVVLAEVAGRERARAAAATEKARGKARQVEALEVERGRGQARLETEQARGKARETALKAQHAGDIEYERALAGARVSTAKPKATEALKGHLRDLEKASRAHTSAGTALRRANNHLKRTLADQTATPKRIASAYGKAQRAAARKTEALHALTGARQAVRAERKRIQGVAPEEADRLRAAIEGKGPVRPELVERVQPPRSPSVIERGHRQAEKASLGRTPPILQPFVRREHERLRAVRGQQRRPIPAVEPAAPSGRRVERATERRITHEQELASAKARQQAAEKIPPRRIVETDEQYLHRLRGYAQTHDLPLLARRVEGLLEQKPGDIAKGYFPRDFDARIRKQLGIGDEPVQRIAAGIGRTVPKITASYRRAEKRRLSSVNPERAAKGEHEFSTDIPLVTLNHLKSVARATSKGEFHKAMADLGRELPVRRFQETPDAYLKRLERAGGLPREGEQIYKLGYDSSGTFGLHQVHELPKKPTKGGRYVALDRDMMEELAGTAERLEAQHAAGRFADRLTGGWKRWATMSLAFHIRNLIGDVSQAYLEQSGFKLPRNTLQAGKAIRRASERARTVRPTKTDSTIKVAGKRMNVDDFLAGAEKHGVLDAGMIGRELQDLSGKSAERVKKLSKGGGRAGQAVDRWMTNRENLMRLSTYKSALDRGLSEEAAADIANRIHIDYGDLSEFERRYARRAMPFYTWTARSLPVTAHALVTKPGKFANLEKAREETGKAFTGKSGSELAGNMTEAIQRQVPFVVKVGGKEQALSFSAPAMLLGELPTSTNLGEYLDELGRFGWGMANPLMKAPFEWRQNRNLVTKREIEPADRPLTAAPSWAKHLPGPAKKWLDVTEGYIDPKTAKRMTGWRGRADWTYDQAMLGWLGQAAGIAGAGRVPGATTGTQAASILGVRADPLNTEAQRYAVRQRAQKERDKLERQRGILSQQGIGIKYGNATPEYKRLSKEINELDKIIDATRPGEKKKKKPSGGGGPVDILGGGGSGGGSGGAGTVDILK